MNVGYVDEFVPYLVLNRDTGAVSGHLVQMWKIIAERMGMRLNVVRDDYSESTFSFFRIFQE